MPTADSLETKLGACFTWADSVEGPDPEDGAPSAAVVAAQGVTINARKAKCIRHYISTFANADGVLTDDLVRTTSETWPHLE